MIWWNGISKQLKVNRMFQFQSEDGRLPLKSIRPVCSELEVAFKPRQLLYSPLLMSRQQSIVSMSASSWSLNIFTIHSLSAVSGWKGSHALMRVSTTRNTCLMLRRITVMSAWRSSESSERSGSGCPDSELVSDSRLELSDRVSFTVTATALRTSSTSFCIKERSETKCLPERMGARSSSRSTRTCRMTRWARLHGSSGRKSWRASVDP